MREIKFRAWDDINKEMIEGFDLYIDPKHSLCTIVTEPSGYRERIRKCTAWMQYTGLKDKNGKEIYEGDIVRSKINNKIWRIYFSERNFCYEIFNKKERYSLSRYRDFVKMKDKSTPLNYLEIIGNIYENSELLKS